MLSPTSPIRCAAPVSPMAVPPMSGGRLLPDTTALPKRAVTLMEMLTYKRPHGSKSERKFVNRFLMPLGLRQDGFGNYYKVIGTFPNILWSSHIDTVHRDSGRQAVAFKDGWLTAPNSTCLGADDGAGVWLMREMILANVPGLYVFHRDEEMGGTGSNWIAKHNPGFLKGIRMAIAFDRKGTRSVITHQNGSRCCSQAFALSLCKALGESWEPDDSGVFTDTAFYTDLVPECTNISVGYYEQHTKGERLYVPFLLDLCDVLTSMDVGSLVIERTPGEVDSSDDHSTYWYSGRSRRDYLGGWNRWDDEDDGVTFRRSSKDTAHSRLVEAILDHTDAVAALLDEYGITGDDILMYAAGIDGR